jgi:hypothetical protein
MTHVYRIWRRHDGVFMYTLFDAEFDIWIQWVGDWLEDYIIESNYL